MNRHLSKDPHPCVRCLSKLTLQNLVSVLCILLYSHTKIGFKPLKTVDVISTKVFRLGIHEVRVLTTLNIFSVNERFPYCGRDQSGAILCVGQYKRSLDRPTKCKSRTRFRETHCRKEFVLVFCVSK